jgi:integrase/recombinase XerC
MFIADFFNYLTYEKRYSPHTIISYKKDISQYQEFLKLQETDVLSANHQVIRNWMVSMLDNGIEPRSVNRKISALRSLYKFLIKEELLDASPVIKVQTPKAAKKLPAFLEEKNISQLLDSNIFTDDFEGKRDRLVMELFFGTGIRLSEAVALTEAKIDFDNKTIKVLGKRNKERVLPVTPTLLMLIKDYLCLKKENFLDNNLTSLLVTNKGSEIYPKYIYRIVRKYLSLITSHEKKSPHIIRHTFATVLLNNGADINAIKELLGHASLAATQVYTHNSIERIKSIYKQAHPKA